MSALGQHKQTIRVQFGAAVEMSAKCQKRTRHLFDYRHR
jgi:hypothetical protein